MTKSKKITILTVIVVVALLAASPFAFKAIMKANKPTPITPVTTSSNITSSEETSSNTVVVVPDIEFPTSSVVSSKPVTEIKVEGNPTSKPTEKPKVDPPKTEVKPTQTTPTGNGDVYDPLTGTYPKIGDKTTSPRSGATLVWQGDGWMATEASGTGGSAANPDDFGEDRIIGAD